MDHHELVTRPFQAIVVGFEPDPGTGERLNIGVVVAIEGLPVQARLRSDWTRVLRTFPSSDERSLARFAARVEQAARALGEVRLDELRERLIGVIGGDLGSICLDRMPRGVTSSSEKLDSLYRRFVSQHDCVDDEYAEWSTLAAEQPVPRRFWSCSSYGGTNDVQFGDTTDNLEGVAA